MADARDTAVRLLQAFNAHDEEVIRGLFAPNSRLEAPGEVRLQGRDALAGHAVVLFNGFPGARITAQNDLVGGPRVMQEFIFEGTHTGPLVGPGGTIPATGRRVVVRGVLVGRYERGLAIDVRLYYDQLDVLTQLGLTPQGVSEPLEP
jgi:predicted ester cyclase